MKTFLSNMCRFFEENKVFVRTFAFGMAVLVIIFSLPIASKAAENGPDAPYVTVPYAETLDERYELYDGVFVSTASPEQTMFLVAFHHQWLGENLIKFALVCPPGEGATVEYTRLNGSNLGSESVAPTNYNSTFDLCISTGYDGQRTDTANCVVYADRTAAEEAYRLIRYDLDNPTPPSAPESVSTLNYSLPPGNVAYVKLPDDISLFQGVTLRTQMPETNLLYAPNGQLWNSSQRTGFTDSLPSADSDLSQYSLISWAKDGETTVLGLTENAIYSRGPLLIGNEYMVIVNPIYYGGTANGPYEFLVNGAVQINAVGVEGISVYALDSSIGFTSQGGITVPTEVIGDPFGGVIDSETGEITWTDPSGGSNAPTEGGNNLIPTGETVFDAVKKIASDFADFLKGPISAIRTVVSAISNFLTEFKSLYIWLPGPVYNLITSAIMVALTIGVVKIFV